jgi:TolB-like protein
MITKFNSILFLIIIALTFTSCSQKISSNSNNFIDKIFNKNQKTGLNEAVTRISNQLLNNIPGYVKANNKIILTSFVDLNTFKKTSKLGRAISESLINDLHTKKFKILDYRTQTAISVSGNGEFALTRDILKLRDEIPEALVLIGTYAVLNETQVVLNARIVDNYSSEVLSTARVLYTYESCKQFDLCIPKPKKNITHIPIVKDNNK